jgi:hypothetical protein
MITAKMMSFSRELKNDPATGVIALAKPSCGNVIFLALGTRDDNVQSRPAWAARKTPV